MTGRDTDWAAAVSPQLVIDTDQLSGPVAQAVTDSGSGGLAFAFEEASLRQAALAAVHAWHGPAAGGAGLSARWPDHPWRPRPARTRPARGGPAAARPGRSCG